MKKKVVPLRKLIKHLDKVFSEYVRLRDSDWRGLATCISCGKKAPWKEYHAGHYISRVHYSTRWNEYNVNAQCPGDNLFKQGASDEYALALQKKHGPDILSLLNIIKHSQVHFTRQDYLSMIADYEVKLERLKQLRSKENSAVLGAKDRPGSNSWIL